jgi:D-alanine-D-alanine ligase
MKNIAVLMGGYSGECEISLRSGKVIADHLDKNKYRVFPIAILKDGWTYTDDNGVSFPINRNDFSLPLEKEHVHFDCCYNTIHGTPGEDGKLQAYLELLNIPQTSCDSYQSAITFNKRDCIAILKPWDIVTGRHVYLNKDSVFNNEDVIKKVGLPCFVKANRSGSSYGVSKVYKLEEMDHALKVAFDVDDEVIVESFLDGMEVSVGVYQLDDEITSLPATEIVTENDFFDYDAKYQGAAEEITPARLNKKDRMELRELSKNIYKVLKLKGIARADFIYHDGIPHFIEMNTNPGMSKESIVPKQIEAAGLSLTQVLTDIIENTLKHFRKS